MTDHDGPPQPPRHPVTHSQHGVERTDPYAGLRDVDSDPVRAHLAAERAFYDNSTRHLRPLVRTLVAEMSSRVPPTDSSFSWSYVRYTYYNRTPEGREFAQLLRDSRRDPSSRRPNPRIVSPNAADLVGSEQLLLDLNELAGASSYIDLGLTRISPDERLLAYSVDTSGDEVFELRFRDLDTGHDLPDRIPRTYYGGAWSADSRHFFYTVHDEAHRPWQVWRHELGTDVAADALVLEEPDPQWDVEVRPSRSGRLVVLWSVNRNTSEVWLVDAQLPTEPARCVEPRRPGVEYHVEHGRLDGDDVVLIVTNDGAPEFRLMRAPLDSPGRDSWIELLPYDPAERIERVDAFAGHLVLSLRRDGQPMLQAHRLDRLDHTVDIASSVPTGSITIGRNLLFDADEVTVVEESCSDPPAWYAVDLNSGDRRLKHRREVPAYDAASYVSESITAPGHDGALIPVTVVRHRDTPLDGSAPCLMWGYGAYESCDDPLYDVALPSLLDRGVVFVQTHPRGGGENGRHWWLEGMLSSKQNTFSDHIAVADAIAGRLVDADRIATRGLSAGGLLQGVVFSQRPDRWCGVVAEVPFVDVVTTMLDPSIPLTANEWDEWGDPRRPDDFAWMLAYSPYDNPPPAGGRPDLLVTGAVHDPRVMVWEPAKWVARLRQTDPGWASRCLFRCETGAGAHTGPAGRYAQLGYEAEVYAWLLDRFGLAA
ncbi:MAG TPA: prolyl oligopeptidase family serine peptidase [Nocardioidaceae bacterium]|nr:prolyl oligopeptidase family serine peptidase [Nocardioidaceae bacterium]